jgi:hypothetical protein
MCFVEIKFAEEAASVCPSTQPAATTNRRHLWKQAIPSRQICEQPQGIFFWNNGEVHELHEFKFVVGHPRPHDFHLKRKCELFDLLFQ